MTAKKSISMSYKKEFKRSNKNTSGNNGLIQNRSQAEATCSFCGAPVRTEICPYCGKPTGLNTASAPMEYPELNCKEAQPDFWGIVFPMIFAVAFGFFGFLFPIVFSTIDGVGFMVKIICIPFAIIGVVSLLIVLRNILMYLSVVLFGKEIEGKVYGYADDTVLYNDIPGQVCKLLVTTSQGKRFIMYQLKSVKKPYPINTVVPLKVYKDRFLVLDKHKYAAWE